jgi:hypothetical protein
LVPTSKFLKIDPRLRKGIRLRVVPCTHSQLINVQKHFIYIQYGFVKHSKWGLRLISDVIASERSVPTSKFLKIDPWLRGGYQAKGVTIYPFTADKCPETLYICIIWICEALQVGFEAHL